MAAETANVDGDMSTAGIDRCWSCVNSELTVSDLEVAVTQAALYCWRFASRSNGTRPRTTSRQRQQVSSAAASSHHHHHDRRCQYSSSKRLADAAVIMLLLRAK